MHFRPFTPTRVVDTAELPGVFEIRDSDGKSLFVGISDNLQFALLSILANPDEFKSLFDLNPKTFAVEYIDNPRSAELMKKALIAQNRPAVQSPS